MSGIPVIVRPGVSTQFTALLNEAGYSASDLIRFKDGLLQKYGGWQAFSDQPVIGKARGILPWQGLDSAQYLAVGTNKILYVYTDETQYDITPVRASDDVANAFSTVDASAVVTVDDTAHGGNTGDGVFIVTPISIAGIILHGYYEMTVVTADQYTITAASPAAATVSGGGVTAEFTTVNTSPSVAVVFPDHGLIAGDPYTIYVSTSVGGLTLFGTYEVDAVSDDDNFTFNAGANASSDDVESENGGDALFNYLLAAGNEDAVPQSGWGTGGYGLGLYGIGEPSTANAPPRQWSFGAWGEDLLANPTNGSLYYWDSSAGLISNPATIVATAPVANTQIFIAMPQRQVVILGAEDNGVQDPLLVKWSDVDDYSAYRDVGSPYDPNSQAGWYRISRGSRIVGGLQGPQQGLIWTDLGLWVMQYVGPQFIYGFNNIADGCGLAASRAAGVINNRVLWVSASGVFSYQGGNVVSVPCSVWDFWFENLNPQQIEKVTCAPNSNYNEIAWFGPSNSSQENDIYIKYNVLEGVWDCGFSLKRTCWTDQSIWGPPIGVGVDGYVYQHELGFDAAEDGLPVPMLPYAETGWFSLNEGEDFVFVERFLPNMIFKAQSQPANQSANVLFTFYFQEFAVDGPQNPVTTIGPFSLSALTNYAIVRGRNRFMKIRIESNDLNSFWRMGKPVYYGSQAGGR